MLIELHWDRRDLGVWGGAKFESAIARALRKAGTDAIRSIKAFSSKGIRAKKRFRVAAVNRALPVTQPQGRGIHQLAWRMDVSGAATPASAFPVRQVRKGVNLAINTGSRKLLKGAFVATMRSGHKGVFIRELLAKPKRVGRLPIEEVYTTRISDVFRDTGFMPAVQAKGSAVFTKAFARVFPVELGKIK
jgi:hypothetical protein